MNRYSLSVIAPLGQGSHKRTIAYLDADLRDLAKDFEGRTDAEFEGQDSTAYRRQYVYLVERDHLLEGRVAELEKRYSADLVQFTLAEYTPKH